MRRRMFGGKIHRATITQADLDYEGSITIDQTLLDAANIVEHEQVHVWNVTRGTRLETYALAAPSGSGVICINGAAAHGNAPGDLVIIANFVDLDDQETRVHLPRVVRVDQNNELVSLARERPGPQLPERIRCG